MKIAFLNGCLEPGQDGVGDYIRSLAQECVRQGHECCTLALNDSHISDLGSVNGHGFDGVRLPATMPWPHRIQAAQEVLTDFKPDWVSLQFVPYGFHPKGTVFGLTEKLQPLFVGRRSHIMFHETWIGEISGASLNHCIVGAVQRRLIVNLVEKLSPSVTHTSIPLYQAMLQRHGHIQASLLPLFGSIPIGCENGDDWLFADLRNIGIEITKANRKEFWLAGFFGSLPPDWPSETALPKLIQAATAHRRRLVILSIGNLVSGEPLWQKLLHKYSPEVTFLKLGRQPTEKISQFLNSLDFGLAATAYGRIGKSSTVAAMLDHGLPVIVSQDESYRTVATPPDSDEPLLYRLDDLDAGLKRQPAHARLPDIAAQFLRDLQRAAVSQEERTPIACTRSQA